MILRHARALAKWHRFEVTQDNWQQAWAMAWMIAGALGALCALFCGLVGADYLFNLGG